MYKQINRHEFKDQFHLYGRGSQFTEWGLNNLFWYLDSDNIELDVIRTCSEFEEVTENELDNDYFMDNLTLVEKIQALEEQTTLVAYDFIDGENHFLIRNF
jgi:hypothetical protein